MTFNDLNWKTMSYEELLILRRKAKLEIEYKLNNAMDMIAIKALQDWVEKELKKLPIPPDLTEYGVGYKDALLHLNREIDNGTIR